MDKKSSSFDFAALLDGQMRNYRKGFNPGDKVKARVSRIGSQYVTLDVNAKNVGLLPIEDVTDAEGNITTWPDDEIEVSFVAMDRDAFIFAKADVAQSAAAAAVDQTIQHAFNNSLALPGKVEKEIKGGYEVALGGHRAFCPYSQIDRFRKSLPEGAGNPYVGQTFDFLVQEYSHDERGANLIVSRRAVLEREAAEAREYLRGSLAEGQTVNGVVVRVLDFGAFVDLGGAEGLVPVREISWDRVVKPSDYVSPGEAVTVKVLSLDWERERISLSIRQCQSRPLKPKTPEELEAEEAAQTAREWMEANRAANEKFTSLSSAFDGIKL